MKDDLHEEFGRIGETVDARLRDGSIFGAVGGWPVCRWVVLPTFGNPSCWEVRDARLFRSKRSHRWEPRLYRACWRKDRDGDVFASLVERLKHPRPFVPTVEIGCVELDVDALESVVDRIGRLHLPLMAGRRVVGIDGTFYELTIGNPWREVRLRWWGNIPKAWITLEPIVHDMADLFEAAWKSAHHVPAVVGDDEAS